MASTNTRIRVTLAGPRVLAVYVLRFHDLTLVPFPTARLVSAPVGTALPEVFNSLLYTCIGMFVSNRGVFLSGDREFRASGVLWFLFGSVGGTEGVLDAGCFRASPACFARVPFAPRRGGLDSRLASRGRGGHARLAPRDICRTGNWGHEATVSATGFRLHHPSGFRLSLE